MDTNTFALLTSLRPAPPGFTTVDLAKRHLLSGPVAVLVPDLSVLQEVFAAYATRMQGLIMTVGPSTHLDRISPVLWHISLDAAQITMAATVAPGWLDAIAIADQATQKLYALETKVERVERQLQLTRHDYNNLTTRLLAQVQDLTTAKEEIKHKLAELGSSERLLRLSSQAAQIGSYEIDLGTSRWQSSPLMDGIFGIDEGFERDLAHWQDLLHPDDRERIVADFQVTNTSGRAFSREYRIVRPANGEMRWVVTWGDYECDSTGKPVLQVGAIQDITERKAAADEIEHLAFYDPLTGLPNRRLLLDRLSQALASSTRNERYGALMFIDLDRFKNLNDTLGRHIGDLLLQQAACRLVACVREGDTVARLGGDEFVLMLEDLSEISQDAATQAEAVGEKIISSLNQPYLLDGHACNNTPSIGVTLFYDHQASVDDLMKRADLAMYQAKAAGRNTLRFFDPVMQAEVTSRAALEADLRHAVLQGQFILYYQAQVDRTGQLTGAEALLRWQHPQRGLVAPLEFIPLAEETGLILPMGLWVLQTACTQLATWAARPETAHLRIAVNVSACQLHQPDFVAQVLAVLAQTGALAQRLKLELTETLLVRDVESVIAKMTALKAHGVGFSLDDFGTGYSSLCYLKRLPLDQLKIDQSFVKNILTDTNDAAIAKMVVALADSLGLAVIAEGVELKEQSDYLALLGCYAYQGYLFGRPVPMLEFEQLMRQG